MSEELFSQQEFHGASQSRKESLLREIRGYDMATILNTPVDELLEYFKERYTMQVPVLKREDVYLIDEPKEVNTTARVPDRVWDDEYVNVNQSFIQFTVCVPFEGDGSLFEIKPTSFQYNLSKKINTHIENNNIHLLYNELSDSKQNLNEIYERDIGMIATNLEHLAHDISLYNNELSELITKKLQERKGNASQNQSLIQSINIPIKKREDIPETYNIPEIRKKPSIIKKSSKIETFKPEPTLALEEYENILTIIKDMSLAMERSPGTFCKLKEEEIRNHFLIQLNGHYKGNATGETFNGVGKTDIIIRHENANAFIAECKFWRGQKKMSEAIDQLLGYVTWRDTKTAILLFNKKPDLSSIMEKVKETITEHKNYSSDFKLKDSELEQSETIFGYKLTHPSDPKKEIFLTLMAFQTTEPDS